MTTFAYADILRPAARRHALAYDIVMVLAGSFVLALASQLAVRLPFSPVPVTAQTLAVLLVGAALGAKRGSLAVIAYLAQGAAGLPVFAGGLSGAGLSVLFLAACWATTQVFPTHYGDLLNLRYPGPQLLLLRNALLAALWVLLLLPVRKCVPS